MILDLLVKDELAVFLFVFPILMHAYYSRVPISYDDL